MRSWRTCRTWTLVAAAMLLTCGVAWAEVSLRVRLDRNPIPAGESTTLVVIVEGANAGVSDPQIALADGVETLGTSRSQSFSWVNGRSTAQTMFRIELGSDREGSYRIGPIRVRVGSQWYESAGLSMNVTSVRPRVAGGTRGGPAEMLVDVTPRDPYVGQPVILRVRLIQRAPLAEDPQYTPPPTPGFWSERSSQPTSYYADEGNSRVLVTETRTRLYPLAAGSARVGEATAVLTLSLPGGDADPFGMFGRVGRRPIQVQSRPVDVHVRALPPGASPGFDGAVGRFTTAWRADRRETPKDVPATVSLEVRGVGNLPLIHTPSFTTPGAEVFSSTVEDSLGPAGTLGGGRRRFNWTALPRTTGTLSLEAPAFAWFDDASGSYEQATPPPIVIQVTPPVGGHDREAGGFPAVFAEHPLDPGGRPARAWGFAIVGGLLGVALARLQALRRRGSDADAPDPPWVEGLRHARGASFWAAAGRACEVLAERGVDVSTWKQIIDAARFGGQGADEDRLRRQLLSRLESTGPRSRRPGAREWAITIAALVAAIASIVLSLPGGGPQPLVQRGIQADTQARRGDVDGATARWRALWNGGGHAPAIAARLAWAAARRGAVAEASAWVLRGDRSDPRDASLQWAMGQVRDAGGLEGFSYARLPVSHLEWGLLALLAAMLATLGPSWAGGRGRWGLLALAVVLALAPTLDAARAARSRRAVVLKAATLEGQGVDLTPGHVVRVLEVKGNRARVAAGAQVTGEVAVDALILEQDPR